MKEEKLINLGRQMYSYCEKFGIPTEFLFEILEDQKVTPMIRGKAMEFNAFLLLRNSLPHNIWIVEKLNLNAQPGLYDEDISITHKRTGIILKVESKSAVRGSISDGSHSKLIKEPHFKVKCHRSRSNISLAGSTNDRYSVDSFDILITNPLNAIYEGKTVGENLEIIHKPELRDMLYKYYNVKNDSELIRVCENDWRFCEPEDIAVKGFIPRTPFVKFTDDDNWKSIDNLEYVLARIIEKKRKSSRHQAGRRS